jgi:exodeoxyribonuclease III
MSARRAVLTIRSWNVENLAPHLAGDGALPSLAEIARAWGDPDVVCLQEIRVRPADAELIGAMTRALPGYDCHYSLANDPVNVTYRGGRAYGVATWLSRKLGATQQPVAWDREGRVVVSVIDKRKLAIINVYAVNGTSKPWFDHALGRVDGDRHRWKRRFNERLFADAAALQARGIDLVMIGDWNISRTRADTHPRLRTEEPHATARAQLNDTLMPALDIVDAFRALHPDARKYTWFNKRARRLDAARVDYALVSRRLLPHVTEADIDEDRAARWKSDHAPLWLSVR